MYLYPKHFLIVKYSSSLSQLSLSYTGNSAAIQRLKSLTLFHFSFKGVDTSENMLAEACANNSAPNITYCLGDAQTVGDNPKWREKFDKVVCFFVLQWVPDKPKALRSILNCLKPGGKALLIVPNRDPIFCEATVFLNGHTKWGDYVKVCSFYYIFDEQRQIYESGHLNLRPLDWRTGTFR